MGAPSPVWEWSGHVGGGDAEGLEWVDEFVGDGAEVRPVVAEVEDVEELLSGREDRELGLGDARGGVVVPIEVGSGDALRAGSAVRVVWVEVEFVEVAAVPSGEGVVDRGRESFERVVFPYGEDPAGSRPEVFAASLDQLDGNGEQVRRLVIERLSLLCRARSERR